ncbi:helix-turn-helix domain-containing protein [Vibrio parahaemolyticus]
MKSENWKQRLLERTKNEGQKIVAVRLGVSQATISEWLNDKYKPSSKKVSKLADELGMEVSILMEELSE